MTWREWLREKKIRNIAIARGEQLFDGENILKGDENNGND